MLHRTRILLYPERHGRVNRLTAVRQVCYLLRHSGAAYRHDGTG